MPLSGSFLRYGIHRQRVFHAVVGKVQLSLQTETTISNGTGATEKHVSKPQCPWTIFCDRSNIFQSLWARRALSSSKHGDSHGPPLTEENEERTPISSWEMRFSELKLYREKHGHCLVPQNFPENQKLGNWVKRQRQFYHAQEDGKSNSLTPERRSKLEAIGFDWDPLGTQWEQQYNKLKLYKEEHGDCLVPKKNKQLGRWVNTQRTQYRKYCDKETSVMTQERISKLEAVGFDWEPYGTLWEKQYNELKLYKEKNGDCLVPRTNKQLGIWVHTQRTQHRKYCDKKPSVMTQERISKLEAIGFDWDPHGTLWEQQYNALKLYKEEHGDCLVPRRNKQLGIWVNTQRTQHRKYCDKKPSLMTQERISKLEAIGFDWGTPNTPWEQRYNALKLYKEEHGDCLVPKKNNQLGRWVNNQRTQYRKYCDEKSSLMTQDRINKLEAIGFDWGTPNAPWEHRYKELKDYVDLHGKGSIPARTDKMQLYDWTREQRYQKRDGKLSQSRIDKLNELEFPWELEEWSRKRPVDLSSAWGDLCQIRDSTSFRIMGLNINGILASNKRDRLRSLVNEHRPNILCLAETNIAWQNLSSDSHLDEFANSFSPGSLVECAWYSDYPHAKRYSQPGGVAIMVLEQGNSPVKVVENGEDPSGLGRWVWVRVKDPSGRHLTVISAYRPVYNVLGESSNYNQHRHFFKSTPGYEAQICPRAQFNKDLASELKRLSAFGDICLFIDANDSVRNEKNEVVRILHEAGLEETSIARFGKNGPPTYQKGSTPIDGIFLTTSVPVKATGYLPFEDGLSDHRPLFVDIPAHIFSDLSATLSHERSWVCENCRLAGWRNWLAGYPLSASSSPPPPLAF